MKKTRDIFDSLSGSSLRSGRDIFDSVAEGGDIFDRAAGPAPKVAPAFEPREYLPSLDGYRPGKIDLNPTASDRRMRPGDAGPALKETADFDRAYPSLSGYEPPEDLPSYLDEARYGSANLQAMPEQLGPRLGPDPMAFGLGFVKGAGRGLTGGVFDPTIYASERPGALMGQFAGGAAPAALAPFAPALVPMTMAGQGFLASASEQASRPGGLVNGLNPLETGSREFTGGLLGALPAAVGTNLPTRIATGGLLGGVPAAGQEAVTQYAQTGQVDLRDPEVVKSILAQTAAGAAFGLVGGPGGARPRGLVDYRPVLPDQPRGIEIYPQEAPRLPEGPTPSRPLPGSPEPAALPQSKPILTRGDIFDAVTAPEAVGAAKTDTPSRVTAEAEIAAPPPSQAARGPEFDQTRAAPGKDIEPAPEGPRPLPRGNFRVPLRRYAPRLYRETNIDRAMEFLPNGAETQTQHGTYHFAENPEMAKGQGGNRGVLLEFDAGDIHGRINLEKPGLDFAFQNRQGEFIASGNQQRAYRDALRSFTVLPGAQGSKNYIRRLEGIGKWVEGEGWTRTKNPDGSITYTRPETSPATAPGREAPVARPEATGRPSEPEAGESAFPQSRLNGYGVPAAANRPTTDAQTSDFDTDLRRAFGEQEARRYRILERKAAGTGPEAEAAAREMDAMESTLPEQDRQRIFYRSTAEPPRPADAEPPSRGAEPPSGAPKAPEGPEIRERSFPKTLEKNKLPGGEDRTYEVKSNAQSVERATREIETAGIEKSIEDVLAETKPSAEHTTKGILLIKRLQEAGDRLKATNPQEAEANFAKAVRIASDLSKKLTEQGQAIQAASIVSRLSPDGIVLYAQSQIRKANAERLFPGSSPDAQITPAQAVELRTAAGKVQQLDGYIDDSKRVSEIIDKAGRKEPLTPEDVKALQDYKAKLQGILPEEPKSTAKPDAFAPPKPKREKRIADLLIEALDKKEQAARARLKARGYRLYSGIPLDDLADFAIIGAARLGKGTIRFADWSAGMAKEFGEGIRPHLAKIYAKAQDFLAQEKARAAKLAANARAINAALSKIDTNTELGAEQAKALADMVEQIKTLSGDAKIEASQELQAVLQALSRPSLGQKVSSAQTIAQLLNPKTAIRNIIGNEIFYRMERLSKMVATPIDMTRSKITGAERQVTFRTEGQGEYWKNFMRGARAAWKGVNPEGIQSKYDLSPASFSGKYNPMTYLERALGVELKAFDFASYMRARNETLGEMASIRADQFKIPASQRKDFVKKWIAEADENLLQIADDYGRYVTFQDETGLSKAAQGVKTALNKATYAWQIENPRFGLGDLVLKYPKTPANLFLRALDYSPAGFVRSAYLIAEPILKGGTRNVREIELGLARAITGTLGFTGMGYYLADQGVISGKYEKDRDARLFRQEQTGERNYQVNISALERWVRSGFKEAQLKKQQGDLLVSYDWAQPISQSIATAATLNQEIENKRDPIRGAANVAGAGIEAGLESLTEQPLLQGLGELFGGNQNTTAAERLTRILEGVPASFMPGLLNQIRQATGNQVPETYSPNPARRALNKAIARLPFVAKTLPEAYKTLGASPREQYQGGTNSLFNVFLNPAFVAKYNLDPIVAAVLAPYEAEGRTKQFPQAARRSLKYTDLDGNTVDLDLEGMDISKLQSIMGFETEKALARVNPAELEAMTFEEQEAALAKLVNQAASRARDQFLRTKGVEFMDRPTKRAFQALRR